MIFKRRLHLASVGMALACLVLASPARAEKIAQTTNPQPPAQVAVSPPLLELPIGDKPVNQSLTLFNLSKETVEVGVSVHNWEMDEANEVRILPPTEQSLDQWMIVNPLRFKIDAGQSQTVRFSVRPRVEPEPGEHRAVIYFSQIPGARDENPGLRVYFRLGVVVYGLVGEITRRGTLHGIEVEAARDRAVAVKFDIGSEGNANIRMDGRYAVWPKAAFPGENVTLGLLEQSGGTPLEGAALRGTLPTRPVLPGTRRVLTLPLAPPEAGEYVLAIQGKLGEAAFSKILPFKAAR